MLLSFLTWNEVEAYLARSPGIIVPIGSTEQHGPSGLIGTDSLCAEAVARGVGEAAEALVAPTITVGMAAHHMAFAGTITYQRETLTAVIQDVVQSLARHGFRRPFFLNGHGGNISTLGAALKAINRAAKVEGTDLRCTFRNWWSPAEVKALTKELFGDADGAHATASEISLTHHLFPDHVKPAQALGVAPPWGKFESAAEFRERYPDGRIGSDPSLAHAEAGARLYRAAVDGVAQAYRDFLAES